MKVIIAIAAITVLELFNIRQGLDGYMMVISVTAIAGLGGYHLKDVINQAKNKLDAIHKACTTNKPDEKN